MIKTPGFHISDEDIPFFAKFGFAFSQWQFVEDEVFELFVDILRCENPKTADLVFHVIKSFDATLLTIDRILVENFPADSEVRKFWTTLQAKLKEGYVSRNELAHWIIAKVPDPPTGMTGFKLHLIPTIRNEHAKKLGQKRNEADVDAMIADFMTACALVKAFRAKIQKPRQASP